MTSRRELYAHGEPFGNNATRRKIDGKGYICGLGGDSENETNYTTNNIDNRVAVQDGIGLSNSSGNSIGITNTNTYNVLDGGIVGRALDSVDRTTAAILGVNDKSLTTSQANTAAALSASRANTEAALSFADGQISRALETVDTTLNDGFQRLLDISKDLFIYGGDLIDQTQSTVAGAYADAQNTAKGTIDNRTIIVLALAGAAALVLMSRRG